VSLAWRQTWETVGQVYQMLRKVFGGQVSPKAFGGPVSIAKMAWGQAGLGVAELLIFLAMLSANLAVINFLPIPVLDGGHMVFLLYEGIVRKPPSERIVVAFTYAGFFLILGLMVFVLGLDIGLISRKV
jgi:regulator of sigma E protease